MNSIDIRTEKANAIFRYRNFQKITTLFRLIEICVFLVAISTFSSQFPFSVRISAEYIKGISFASISPRFVFVIGNAIILILLFKSRVSENGDPYGQIDVYDEHVKRCQSERNDSQRHRKSPPEICRIQSEKMMTQSVTERQILKNSPAPEICRNQSEKIMTKSVTERQILKNSPAPEICRSQSEKMMTQSVTERKILKNLPVPAPEICRSQSEKIMRVECNDSQSRRRLMRSVTDKEMLKNVETPATVPEICGVDELSSEAFRRTVEAFIARQQQSLRDEELAPVAYVCS